MKLQDYTETKNNDTLAGGKIVGCLPFNLYNMFKPNSLIRHRDNVK